MGTIFRLSVIGYVLFSLVCTAQCTRVCVCVCVRVCVCKREMILEKENMSHTYLERDDVVAVIMDAGGGLDNKSRFLDCSSVM